MENGTVKLGLLCPPGGGEYEYFKAAEALDYRLRPVVACVRLAANANSHSLENLRRTAEIENLQSAARSLANLNPDSAMWACTSASFVHGRKHAEAQCRAIEALVGCPVGSTSLAFVAALEATGISRVAVAASYPEAAARLFGCFLAEFGINVEKLNCMDAPSGQAAFELSPEQVMRAARDSDAPNVDAILIPDTAMACLPIVTALERETGKLVLSANQVTLWHGMRLAGFGERMPGFGRLLEQY